MKKAYLLFTCAMACCIANATNYYVDAVNGSNGNAGTDPSQAFRAIQNAANLTNAGDTVFIMDGLYTTTSGSVISINRSGDATGQIVYTNYSGALPKLQATVQTYAVISLSAGISYITINGLEISGYGVNLSLAADTIPAKAQEVCVATGTKSTSQTPLQKYNGHGIIGNSRGIVNGSHHIIITNNKVHDNCAAGINLLNADYTTISGNTVYNNSWYTIYGTSGISFNDFYNYDNNNTTYRNIVTNNISYGNRMYVPYYGDCKITDGNGVILDVPTKDTLTGSPTFGQVLYTGKSLVANNICFNNGGSGIHSFSMNHSDIFNNISYLNSASPEINSNNIFALQADDVKIINNIIVARPSKRINGLNSSTNLIYDYNIYFGTNSVDLTGTHSLIQDPKFVNPSTDPTVADFHLKAGSPAINTGDNSHTYATDYAGTARPFSSTNVDIGAYETSYTSSLGTCSGGTSSLIISNGNGNGLGEAGASTLYGMSDTKPSVSGQKSRKAIIYPAGLLTSIPANTTITGLRLRRAIQTSTSNTTPSTQVVPDNTNFRVYLRNEASDNFGSTAFDWNTILPTATNPATLVYGGDATNVVGNAGGWKDVIFQVPFTYTGGSIGVYVEYIQNGGITAAPDINWLYDNGGSQPLYNTTNYPNAVYGFRSINASGTTTLSNSLTYNNERRPVITFNYCGSGLLPVTWLGLNASKQNNGNLISWSTTNETNNTGFKIQRSNDGISFANIGFVATKTVDGNSAAINNYDFTDVKPFEGASFYRLLQIDKDGKETYSSIVSVTSYIDKISLVSAYPNPVSSKLTALVNNVGAVKTATISLQDYSGRTLNKFQKLLPIGYSNIELDLSKQASSSYLLVIELSSGERLIHKFIKL